MYEVDSLKDVEFLLKRVIREEVEPIAKAAKARVRVVDRVTARLEEARPVELPVASVEVDWGPLWEQLALQDAAYAAELIRALEAREEDDLEAILLLH
jgi:FKBP-type peptidyl-prolyl cis-trans isomerase (trigger factor)